MGVPAVTGASDLEIDLSAGEVRVERQDAARRRSAGHRRHDRCDHHRRRPARRARGERGLRHRPALGRRAADAARARQRRHPRGRRARPASSAPRASACAGPSTCSSATTGTRRWSRSSSPPRSTSAASGSPSSRRCSRATSRGSSRRWRGCRSRSACSIRRCTSSSPTPTTCPRGADSVDRARVAAGGQPDARHARCAARDPLSGDLRDAGRAMMRAAKARARAHRRHAPSRDHGPARGLRARARRSCATTSSASAGERGPRAPRRLHDRHDDRAASRLLSGRSHRQRGRLLLFRHQRPHADRRWASAATTSRARSSGATSR